MTMPAGKQSRLFRTAWANTQTETWETFDPAVSGKKLAYRATGDLPGRAEPAYTFAECFVPPHPLAVPKEWCEAVIATAKTCKPEPARRHGGNIWLNARDFGPGDLDPTIADGIIERLAAANRYWWQLKIERWSFRVKNYRVGESMVEHPDLHAHTATLKLAATIQLSEPKYEGGGVQVLGLALKQDDPDFYPIPCDQGTVLVMPGWTRHMVTAVTEGERWALCINGHGPRLR
jgi:hypothetical protein